MLQNIILQFHEEFFCIQNSTCTTKALKVLQNNVMITMFKIFTRITMLLFNIALKRTDFRFIAFYLYWNIMKREIINVIFNPSD